MASRIIKDAVLDTLVTKDSVVVPVVTTTGNNPTRGRVILDNDTGRLAYADGLEWHDLANEDEILEIEDAPVVLTASSAVFPNGSVIQGSGDITVTLAPGTVTIGNSAGPSDAEVALVTSSADFPDGRVIQSSGGITIDTSTPGIINFFSSGSSGLTYYKYSAAGAPGCTPMSAGFVVPPGAINPILYATGAGAGGAAGDGAVPTGSGGSPGGGAGAACIMQLKPGDELTTFALGTGGAGGSTAGGSSAAGGPSLFVINGTTVLVGAPGSYTYYPIICDGGPSQSFTNWAGGNSGLWPHAYVLPAIIGSQLPQGFDGGNGGPVDKLNAANGFAGGGILGFSPGGVGGTGLSNTGTGGGGGGGSILAQGGTGGDASTSGGAGNGADGFLGSGGGGGGGCNSGSAFNNGGNGGNAEIQIHLWA